MKGVPMKKKLTALFLIMMMIFTLAACGSSGDSLSDYAGTYGLSKWVDGDTAVEGDDIAAYGLDAMELTLNEDGTGHMSYGDTEEDFDLTWEIGRITVDGETQDVTMDGETIEMDTSYTSTDEDGNETTISSVMTFTKKISNPDEMNRQRAVCFYLSLFISYQTQKKRPISLRKRFIPYANGNYFILILQKGAAAFCAAAPFL